MRSVKGEHGTLEVSRQLQQLKEVLLAEHPDASCGAKNRCTSLRSGFAHALKSALSQTPEGQQLLEGPKTPPKARVEVRHTAARVMLSEVFTVGRAAECDVQTTGDPTTSRLQFLVISLPQGLCIADAWSGGGTRVVRRETGELPASVPQHRATFMLPHGERVTLMTGAKTTVTFGPAVKDLKKVNGAVPTSVNGAPTEVPRVPTMRLVEEAKIKPDGTPKAVPAPAPSSGPNGAAPATNGTVATTVAVAAPSSPGSCAYLCSRAIASLRTNLRAQQQQALRERLKGRLWAAQRQKLIAKQQLLVFQERLEDIGGSDGASVEDLRDFLDGLGVAPAPDDPCTSTWTCSICKASQKCKGFRCPFRHRACRDCFLKQVDSKCPIQSCGYILGAADMQDLRFSEDRCKVFPPTAKVQESCMPCRAGCGAALSLAQAKRQAWSCSCGAAPVCTACGVTPYHYHGKCAEVQVLRARWQSWISGGREAYKAFQKRLTRTAKTQQRALQEALEIGSQAEDAEMQSQPAESPRAVAPKAKAKAKGRPGIKGSMVLGGHGVRHLLTSCSMCSKTILGPRFRCIHCTSYSVCQRCEPKLANQHPEGHVFEIMFEDDLDWEKADVQLPKNLRARLRFTALQEVPGNTQGRKRSLSAEGVLRGMKRGKYNFELADGSGSMEVSPKDVQPLLTQKQAERLSAAGIFEASG